MRKTLVVALREYNAAVRTRAFLIGLLLMPLLMGGSILAQRLLGKYRDTRERKFAVVDRTPGAVLVGPLKAAVAVYNTTTKDKSGALVLPPFALEVVTPDGDTKDAVEELRVALSERVRKNDLAGFLEIDPAAIAVPPPPTPAQGETPPGQKKSPIRYYSNRVTDRDFANLTQAALAPMIQTMRGKELGISPEQANRVAAPVTVSSKGLAKRDPTTGAVTDASEESRMASIFAPMIVMMLMFMLVLMTATPLMQGVVEEKMQRIAEVLLGSVSPFQLMLGKLLGMTGVSLTIAAVYLGGAYWAAHRFGVGEYATPQLIAWFALYQVLAALMYGSLFIAVGAACTDMRETQNLLWPVTLLAALPMFVLANVIREPNSAVVTALSFFPFATPTLMLGRQAVPPGVPPWQPVVASIGVLLTTLFCVWAAGRIFRVGILLQGKGASPAQIARWVFRG